MKAVLGMVWIFSGIAHFIQGGYKCNPNNGDSNESITKAIALTSKQQFCNAPHFLEHLLLFHNYEKLM